MNSLNRPGGEDGSDSTTIDPSEEVSTLQNSGAPRRRFSLSDLAHSGPLTDQEIRCAIAQGRFAELTPDQI